MKKKFLLYVSGVMSLSLSAIQISSAMPVDDNHSALSERSQILSEDYLSMSGLEALMRRCNGKVFYIKCSNPSGDGIEYLVVPLNEVNAPSLTFHKITEELYHQFNEVNASHLTICKVTNDLDN